MRRFIEMLKRAGMAVLGAVALTVVPCVFLLGTVLVIVMIPVAAVIFAVQFIVPRNWWDAKGRRWEGASAGAVSDGKILKMTVWDRGLEGNDDTYVEIDTQRIVDEFEFVREELFRLHLGFNWRKGAAVEMWVEKLEPATPGGRGRIQNSQIQNVIGVWVTAGPNEEIMRNAKRIEVATAAEAKAAMGIGAEEYRLIGEAARVSLVVLIFHDWGYVCVAEWR